MSGRGQARLPSITPHRVWRGSPLRGMSEHWWPLWLPYLRRALLMLSRFRYLPGGAVLLSAVWHDWCAGDCDVVPATV